MDAYYELSYVDEFGNGTHEYFYCTEQQIKIKAKELFDKEIKFLVDDDKFKKTGLTRKKFEFNNDTCKGYIVKEVGFILAHYIDWEKIEVKNKKYQPHLYLVEEQGHWCTCEKCGVFSNLIEAKAIAREINDCGEKATVDEHGNRLYNGVVRRTKYGWSCSKYYWEKVSYEYDEWDINANTRTIKMKEVKKISNGR